MCELVPHPLLPILRGTPGEAGLIRHRSLALTLKLALSLLSCPLGGKLPLKTGPAQSHLHLPCLADLSHPTGHTAVFTFTPPQPVFFDESLCQTRAPHFPASEQEKKSPT